MSAAALLQTPQKNSLPYWNNQQQTIHFGGPNTMMHSGKPVSKLQTEGQKADTRES